MEELKSRGNFRRLRGKKGQYRGNLKPASNNSLGNCENNGFSSPNPSCNSTVSSMHSNNPVNGFGKHRFFPNSHNGHLDNPESIAITDQVPVVNYQVFRGRNRNFRRGTPMYHSGSSLGLRDNRNQFAVNYRHHRHDNSLSNSRGNSNFKDRQLDRSRDAPFHPQNQSTLFQNERGAKDGVHSSHEHSTLNSSTEVFRNKPRSNYRRVGSVGRSQGRGHPLGMYWPQLSPLKESEVSSASEENVQIRIKNLQDQGESCEDSLDDPRIDEKIKFSPTQSCGENAKPKSPLTQSNVNGEDHKPPIKIASKESSSIERASAESKSNPNEDSNYSTVTAKKCFSPEQSKGDRSVCSCDAGGQNKGGDAQRKNSCLNCKSKKDVGKQGQAERDGKKTQGVKNWKGGERKKRIRRDPYTRPFNFTLDLNKTFDQQAEEMIKQFEMTPRERARVDILEKDLQNVFSPLIPGVQPVLFGSMVAGTAFSNSDVDIYLQCYESLPTGNVKDFIMKYGSAVNKGGYFRQAVKIANARVPIVKAIHNLTNISVDISFVVDKAESHYGLCNSLLVKHLCSSDPRVRDLIMLVLFWAKYHGFIGQFQMSSFTFILMTIFYLQVVDILPPLHKLIEVSSDATCWPTSFNPDISLLSNNNTESLESLYLGFFSFYSAVRFDEVVISVYAGELVLSVLFDTCELLPSCFEGYKRLVLSGAEQALSKNEMCVQEPFNMSWNTVRSVNVKIIEHLKNSCVNVCNVFTKFSSKRALAILHSGYQLAEGQDDSYLWELPCPQDSTPEEWFETVLKATKCIFNEILLMDILTDSQMDLDDRRYCRFYLSDRSQENPVRLVVSSEYQVFLAPNKERVSLAKAFSAKKISDFEKEVKVSRLLLEGLVKNEKRNRYMAMVFVARNEKNGSAEVSVSRASKYRKWKKREHLGFVAFLKNEHFTSFLRLALERNLAVKTNTT